ncbi:MAG TPA: FliA/WhiG family RNA polymerase sigma factor [Ruminiclostridium sp.]|nr:FliA/WhiG family RNA polymerase sigma factor [Ruminiclostridium sp.]
MQTLLDEETVVNLWKSYRENPDIELRNKIVILYAGLVKSLARRAAAVSGSYVDIDDLVSFGMIGLIKAVEKFIPEKGVTFETYATYRIRGEIIDYMRRNDWVPRGVRKRAQVLEKAAEEFKSETGREPTEEELSVKLGVKKSDIVQAMADSDRVNLVSFEEVIQDSSIKDDSFVTEETPESALAKEELVSVLARSIEALPERERLVITLYYYEELTLKEISTVLSVSESRVSQIHTRAVKKLKNVLSEY